MNDLKVVAAIFVAAFMGTFLGSATALLFMWMILTMAR